MENKNNMLVEQPKYNIVNTLNSLSKAIEEGVVSKYQITQDGEGRTTIQIDSSDGENRIINSHHDLEGYNSSSTIKIKKQPINKRREIVKQLRQDGLTQTEIAKRTMVSQKTIANDIQYLKESKSL